MTVREIIILTASYYSKTLSEPLLEMYAEDLADLPVDQVLVAYKTYRRNPKNKFFPLPAQIREIVCPEATPSAESRDVVERIKIAIGKFGYMSGLEAQVFIGPVGWQIVQGLGGWLKTCESNFITNSSLIAQARTRGEDLINFEGNISTENLLSFSSELQKRIEASNNMEEVDDQNY